MSLTDPILVSYLVVSQLNLPLSEEQTILEIEDMRELLRVANSEINKKPTAKIAAASRA